MPRFSKQAPKNPIPQKGEWDFLAREAQSEADLWKDVSQTTRLTYEANAKLLAEGWDMAASTKGTRGRMRAAGVFVMRKQLKAMLKEALNIRKKGQTGAELFNVREAQFARKMEGVLEKLTALRAFQALDWSCVSNPGRRVQKSHKQRPATDSELRKFYEQGAKSIYYEHFLVAEFSGVRGQEFEEGVRVELAKKGGIPTLSFYIQSVKSDGKQKGLDMRCNECPFPSEADESVQRRWLDLAKRVQDGKKSYVVRIKQTGKSTVGRAFTDACRNTSVSAGVHVAAYSLRGRYSAQVKQANPGDAVAVALAIGHQTTDTQGHYPRASRGGGDVSPVQSTGINVSGQTIRGAPERSGPPPHIKEKTILNRTTPGARSARRRSRGRRL